MKKAIILLLAISLLLPPAAHVEELADDAYIAENMDSLVASMVESFQEYSPMQLEIIYRASKILHDTYTDCLSIDGVHLEPGIYEIGDDIPEGNYYFEGVRNRISANIYVFPSLDKMHASDEIQCAHYIGYGLTAESVTTGKFILTTGCVLKIASGPAIIHVYTGLPHN